VKIVSGGQTGVDRAALDVALKHRIECGGWCPAGRLDEFGRIPDRYPVQDLEEGNKEERDIFAKRTHANVRDSDGTLIIYPGSLSGGTLQTIRFCTELRRPPQLINASKFSAEDGAKLIFDFVRKHKIDVLNVAGPRQSEWAGGYDYAFRALDIFVAHCSHRPMGG
jgi:hypothetical protein